MNTHCTFEKKKSLLHWIRIYCYFVVRLNAEYVHQFLGEKKIEQPGTLTISNSEVTTKNRII